MSRPFVGCTHLRRGSAAVKFKAMRIFAQRKFVCVLALLFCHYALAGLPRDVAMNPDAGRGGLLFVTLHLEDGQPLAFVMDTGCPTTCLDESLEPRLGKPLRTNTLWSFGVRSRVIICPAPKLYLENTLLEKTGSFVMTHDCRQMSASVGRPILGVLGIDVLQHYCVQLDFKAGIVRFLSSNRANKRKWGAAFPIMRIGDGCPVISDNLAGLSGVGSLIDTGCNYDGWLIPQLYQQWTDPDAVPAPGQSHAPNGVLRGVTYANVDLHGVDPKAFASGDTHIQFNGIGLSFLARHLVTLDFPDETLYLKRARKDPPETADMDARFEAAGAARTLRMLALSGQLPGWPASDELSNSSAHFSLDANVITFDIRAKGDSSTYRYTLKKSGEDWRLTKAWRTDDAGNVLNEFPVQ